MPHIKIILCRNTWACHYSVKYVFLLCVRSSLWRCSTLEGHLSYLQPPVSGRLPLFTSLLTASVSGPMPAASGIFKLSPIQALSSTNSIVRTWQGCRHNLKSAPGPFQIHVRGNDGSSKARKNRAVFCESSQVRMLGRFEGGGISERFKRCSAAPRFGGGLVLSRVGLWLKRSWVRFQLSNSERRNKKKGK